MKWLLVIVCLGFLCGCGEDDVSSLERRVAALEAASNIPEIPVQLLESTGVNWAKWVSSLATLLAVLTSLWLASRDRLIRLVVEPKIEEDDFIVSIANIGRRDAVIVSVEAYMRFSKGQSTKSIFGGGDAQDKLEDGDLKRYSSEDFLPTFKEQAESLTKFERVLLQIGLIGAVVEVKVSTGRKYSASIRLYQA